jgi:V/A-type H+-transporting ATPase subunit E
MALEDIFKTLDKEEEKGRKRILKAAQQEVNKIIRLAEEDAEQAKQKELERVSLSFKGETARIINQARLHKKEESIRAKEKLINKAFEKAELQIKNLRQDKAYERVLENLAREAFERVDGHVAVSVDKQDEALARKVLDRLSNGYELRTDITCLGGLSVKTLDGKITYLNTIDARMEKGKQILKTKIVETLFSS